MDVEYDLRKGYSLDENAAEDAVDVKQPYIDNGTGRLDPKRYYSSDFMKDEWDHMWTKTWNLAGPLSDISDPGDYFLFDLGRESIIITRTKEGDIKAFYNVCPHRGNRLLREEFGSLNRITCSFHSWSFGLDGKCEKVTDEETFRPEVLCHDHDLTALRVAAAAGLIFVSMNEDVMPLEEYLEPLMAQLSSYEIDKMHVISHIRSEWAANWKTGLDAFYELYHLHAVHPETQAVMEDYKAQYDMFANGMSRMIVPFAIPSSRTGDQESMNEGIEVMLADAGLTPDEFPASAKDARVAVQKGKRRLSDKLNLNYERYTDAQLSDSFATGIFPNVQLGCHPEAVFIMRFLPHPTDPEKFYYDNIVMYRHIDVEGYKPASWMGLPEDIDLTGQVRPDIIHISVDENPDLGLVLNQDSELLPFVQKGIRSKGFKGPLWCEQEGRLRHFHAELDKYIARKEP